MATEHPEAQSTRIIHNQRHRDAFGSPYSPIYNTTIYRFPDTEALLDVIADPKQAIDKATANGEPPP